MSILRLVWDDRSPDWWTDLDRMDRQAEEELPFSDPADVPWWDQNARPLAPDYGGDAA